LDKRTPSLHLLKIFEAAGRKQSFKLAAEELHITPSAVSHQIKTLEQQLGFALFKRLNRRLELTLAGKRYLDVITDVFHRLNKGTANLLHQYGKKRLKISMMQSLASHLLIPKLSELKSLLPDVELIIDATSDVVDFNHSDVDVAIRFGQGHWPGVTVEKLSDCHISPMCHPELAQTLQLDNPTDLAQAPLIGFSFISGSWQKFSNAMNMEPLSADSHLSFNNYDMALQAAEQKAGVVLGIIEMERHHLKTGHLMQPFDIALPMSDALYLVHRPQDKQRDEIKQFAQWFNAILLGNAQ